MAETWTAVMFGCTSTQDADDLELVKAQLHDQLVAGLGPLRQGPVVWQWSSCREGLSAYADDLRKPQWGEVAAWCRDHPDGYLVVASAGADPRLVMGAQRG